ncbi:AAA family ATPase [Streptomyces goshikiensis]|uniref:AAA family ATPase n=1 Tax=Streptomyces goshikiensis TaxID=1942 RepID=UPI0037101647
MIDRLAMRNFKAFREIELPLGALTLLTGLNSSGKSTVLQALGLLHQSYTAGDLDHVAEIAVAFAEGRAPDEDHGNGFLLNSELVGLGTGQDVLHEDFTGEDPAITLGVTEGRYRYAWTVGYAPEQNLLPLTATDLPLVTEGVARPEGDAAIQPAWFTAGFQYLHADRITPAEFYPRDHHAVIGRGFLGARGEHTVNYLRHHAKDEVPEGPLRHPRAQSRFLLDQVAAWMGDLCPGVDIQADAIAGADVVQLSYGFEGSVGPSLRRRPGNVGFGLTYVLPIVVACLTARPGSLILLENPEAHLHPQGQTRMAGLAAAAAAHGAQLVVETHSDHVINGVRLAVKQGRLTPEQVVLHYFRGDGTGVDVVSPKVDRDGLLDQWPEGFFDELENTLDQLIG